MKSLIEIPWCEFPEGLERDIGSYLQGLDSDPEKPGSDDDIRPLKPVTIHTRRAEFQGAARMAVKAGVPIETTGLPAVLLAPDVAEKVLNAYREKNGGNPKLYTIDLAGRFLAIAKETKCLSDADCDLLDEMREVLGRRSAGRLYPEEHCLDPAGSSPRSVEAGSQSALRNDG